MTHSPGDQLLHYRLVEEIGRGGMGVVWRATDLTLERDVAIKVLPSEVSADQTYLARFELEAKLLAALSHPNIAQVFGLHESDGVRFLAMELVDGTDLARALRARPLSIEATIDVGLRIASALESAHTRGVVHRDLKPANVMRAPDGQIKVLDFGLARRGEAEVALDPTLSPTMTMPATMAGTLLGTAAYMSPEQARGQQADKRSDMWAFGCLLYECLTGKLAFRGDTTSDTLAAVLRAEPDWAALPRKTPRRLRELLARCLEKGPDDRQRDAGDAALDLRTARAELEAGDGEGRRSGPASWRMAGLAVALVATAALGFFLARDSARAPERVVRSTLNLPDGWLPVTARISPDGRFVGVAAELQDGPAGDRTRRVFLRDLARDDDFVPLEGDVEHWWFRFSPDSRQIAIAQISREAGPGVTLARAPVDGSSPPVAVTPWGDSWSSDAIWLSDAELAVVANEPPRLIGIPLDGSPPSELTAIQLESDTERFLVHSLAPDGAILGTIESWTGGYHQNAARLDPETGEVEMLVDRAFEPTYIEPGRLAFSRGDQLLVVPFDPHAGKASGVPEVVATGLRNVVTAETAGFFSISDRGDLLHIEGGPTGLYRRLVWVGEDGSRTPFGASSGPIVEGFLDDSADGSVLAFVRLGPTVLYEVWATETDSPAPRRVLARDGMDCQDPVVSPTGDRIAALCIGDQRQYGLYLIDFPSIDTGGRLLLEASTGERLAPRSWTPDGRRLFVRRTVAGVSSIQIAEVDDSGAAVGPPMDVEGLEGDIGFAMVSDDGRWIGFSRWDGSAWSLEIAPWDGRRAGPARPALRAGVSWFDWTGVDRNGGYELAAVDTSLAPKLAVLDSLGRVVRIEDSERLRAAGMLAVAYLRDGRMIGLESSPEEEVLPGLRLITDWASTLR